MMDGTLHAGPFRTAHVLIIGGGASGVMMARQLLRKGRGALRVTLIERAGRRIGHGLAYDTADPGHLLNTRSGQMSACPDDPAHFLTWLAAQGLDPDPCAFVARATYGRYLESLLPQAAGPHGFRHIAGTCTALAHAPSGVTVQLEGGRHLRADAAILATGHAVPTRPDVSTSHHHDTPGRHVLTQAWDFSPPPAADSTVAIIGTGLSMVDHVVRLLRAAHRGPILCLSRRGVLPRPHAAPTDAPLPTAGTLIGLSPGAALRALRGHVRAAQAQGHGWQAAVDAIRPEVAQIWQGWSLEERGRFLRHGAAFWESHRHRMPPASARAITEAQARGQMQVLRAAFLDASTTPDGRIDLRIRPGAADQRRAAHAVGQGLVVDHLIDCRGIRRDHRAHAGPVVRHLLDSGAARLDPLGLGLDTTAHAEVIDAQGQAARRIFAIGPAARGTFWELTAVPEIRAQVDRLAHRLVARLAASIPADASSHNGSGE